MSILTAYDKFIQQALKYGFSLFGTAKTGQTIKYRTGDDGDFEKGYPRSGVKFVDNEDGTITDNATGLMWIKDHTQLGGAWWNAGAPGWFGWTWAIDKIAALTYAGHNDWRLPNLKELMSIVDVSKDDPCINETFFPNTISGYYWTSTTRKIITSHAWVVWFDEGATAYKNKFLEYQGVRPVRLGVPKD